MAIYAIGDVQGCYGALQKLLEKIRFDPAQDSLWFTGDLVNRGHQSADVLRFVKGLGERAVTVLGNHDLHMLAASIDSSCYRRHDTFKDVLEAPDSEELLSWLRYRPLLHHDARLSITVVHAGLAPQWNVAQARNYAKEVEDMLQSEEYTRFFSHMYGDKPKRWSEALTGWERMRFIVNTFTRIRYCDKNGKQALKEKGAIGSQPNGLMPWFNVPGRASEGDVILFGHWAALGIGIHGSVYAIDSGCAWGGALSALRVDGERTFTSVPCRSVAEIT